MTKEQVFDPGNSSLVPDVLQTNNDQQQISDLLGPVVLYWLYSLHQHIRYLDDGKTTFLYCARAGVRIRELYREFLKTRELGADPGEMFWISRIAACKGVFAKTPDYAAEIIQGEFENLSLQVLLDCLFRQRPDVLETLSKYNACKRASLPATDFTNWINRKTTDSKRVNSHLRESSRLFKSYLEQLSAKNKRIVLIDSGWQGTTQKLLANAFPGFSWFGLYFGVIKGKGTGHQVSGKAIGTVFNATHYDPAKPETAFLHHRHLIEALLETNAPSIGEVAFGDHRVFVEDAIVANSAERPDPVDDAIYLAVRDYIQASADKSIAEIHSSYQCAMARLARLLTQPKREEVTALSVKSRSADFGKTEKVPLLFYPEEHSGLNRTERLKHAIWTQGQIALEYPAKTAIDMQNRSLGLTKTSGDIDPFSTKIVKPAGRVAIITRTKNRPVLLKRAAQSVADQTYRNIVWVIVNDGGDAEAVRDVVNSCYVEQSKIIQIDHDHSLGMEAASNAGIAAVQSDFILIHDDDDSLAPEFVEKAVTCLRSAAGSKFGGVITKSIYVSEEICEDAVIEHGRAPYNDWVSEVQLAEMAAGNFFPPISFLYRRDMWKKIGGYCETLPVLGDWKFNLDFLCHADIGFIDEALAYYHHRDRDTGWQTGAYSNSVTGGIDKHKEYAPLVRNMIIRDPENYPVLSGLMATAYFYSSASGRTRQGTLPPAAIAAESGVKSAGSLRTDRDLIVQKIKNRPVFGNLVSKALQSVEWAERAIVRWAVSKGGRVLEIDPTFDELTYLKNNTDVSEAVKAKLFSSGYEHYVLYGTFEGRLRPGSFKQRFE